jgi:hypothetical protein
MYQSISEVLTENQSIWQNVPAFSNAEANFTAKLDTLRIKVSEQLTTTEGVTADKTLKISDLRERILVMQNALMLYARAAGNTLLMERNRKTKTALYAYSIVQLAARCVDLKADLDSYGASLTDYGITGEMIAEITPLLDSVNEIGNSTRKAILKRKSITEEISQLEHAIDEILHVEMDKLVMVFKISQPKFYKAFKNARTIVDHGYTKGTRFTQRTEQRRHRISSLSFSLSNETGVITQQLFTSFFFCDTFSQKKNSLQIFNLKIIKQLNTAPKAFLLTTS